jgi:hypothetical protein
MSKTGSALRHTAVVAGIILMTVAFIVSEAPGDGASSRLHQDLEGPFDLGAARSPQVQYFRMETQFVHLGFDGKRTGAESYVLTLKCVPAPLSGKEGDEYTCREFTYQVNDGPVLTIPSLAGWSYRPSLSGAGRDEKGQVLGIPHAKFEGIADSRGNKLAVGIGYAVYNNFVDFHAFNDIFARPTAGGRGIQDLRMIGQKIVHAAAFSEPPVNLGAGIKEGSVFRNGEVTLELKGLSVVDGAACAIVGYDSGESTLRMIMPLDAGKDMETVGGSEYKGDIYVDLTSRWVRKVTMDEFVVTETRLPAPGPKITAYTVRHLLMRMIGRDEYERNQPAEQ